MPPDAPAWTAFFLSCYVGVIGVAVPDNAFQVDDLSGRVECNVPKPGRAEPSLGETRSRSKVYKLAMKGDI